MRSVSSLRRLTRLALLGLAQLLPVVAQMPSAADGFNPNVDGTVFVLVTQADGKLLVGGQFTAIQGNPRNNLARLNVDGSLDQSFNPSPNAAVRALAVQADNRIVIGGDFTYVDFVPANGSAAFEISGSEEVNGIATTEVYVTPSFLSL